ncbi:MAG: ATP/GTP-binding protein [Thermoplasmata archaeon]|nr:MAG: ATP/GTP-binding protein [Thermoplasmata archaeon]
MVSIFFAGTAGAGKSTLVGTFQRWMDENGYNALTVNLDPGAEVLAYDADLDVREWVVLGQIMEEFNLGPNGAQVVAADMMAIQSQDIASAVAEMEADYVLFDVPGQLELFAFRSSSKRILENLGGSRPALAYLLDPMLVGTPNGYVTSMLLAATVKFRFDAPMLFLLSKADLIEEDVRSSVMAWNEDVWRLQSDLWEGDVTPAATFATDLLDGMKEFGASSDIIPVSSASGEGLEDIYSMVQVIYAGGDDLERR